MKNKYLGITIIYILIVVLIYLYDANQLIEEISYQQLNSNTVIGEITKDIIISGNIILEDNNISGLGFMFGTYNRKNTGDLIINIKDNQNDEKYLYKANIDISQIQDNEIYSIDFNQILNIPDKEIYFEIIAPNSTENNAITLWYNKEDIEGKTQIFLNGESIIGELVYIIKTKFRKGLF